MKILYTKSFDRDIESIGDNSEMKRRLLEVIGKLKETDVLINVPGIKRIEGYANYYRLRLGDYRLGMKLSGDTLEMIRLLHRKDIYRRFP